MLGAADSRLCFPQGAVSACFHVAGLQVDRTHYVERRVVVIVVRRSGLQGQGQNPSNTAHPYCASVFSLTSGSKSPAAIALSAPQRVKLR